MLNLVHFTISKVNAGFYGWVINAEEKMLFFFGGILFCYQRHDVNTLLMHAC